MKSPYACISLISFKLLQISSFGGMIKNIQERDEKGSTFSGTDDQRRPAPAESAPASGGKRKFPLERCG
jgi:hypothetical protein